MTFEGLYDPVTIFLIIGLAVIAIAGVSGKKKDGSVGTRSEREAKWKERAEKAEAGIAKVNAFGKSMVKVGFVLLAVGLCCGLLFFFIFLL